VVGSIFTQLRKCGASLRVTPPPRRLLPAIPLRPLPWRFHHQVNEPNTITLSAYLLIILWLLNQNQFGLMIFLLNQRTDSICRCRLSLLTGRYVVIKTPEVVKLTGHKWAMSYLSKSQKGVYYTAVAGVKLWVWALNEESTTVPPLWEMVHRADQTPSLRQLSYEALQEKAKSWILDDPARKESAEYGYREWESEDDDDGGGGVNFPEPGGNAAALNHYMGWLDFLGYHPHKEIVFFGYQDEHCAFAYFLRTSKLEYLGHHEPVSDNRHNPPYVQESFVYTPCRIDLLSDKNGTSVDLSSWVPYPVNETT
jgi:hypothetical protein